MKQTDLIVVGGGLAGSEAAWQAAKRGIRVELYEMRPAISTGVHKTPDLAELICSNSLGSKLTDRASGLLKDELNILGSLLLKCAESTAVPAGNALAVDRKAFSQLVTEHLTSHSNIRIIRKEIIDIPSNPCIIASGPLTSERLSQAIASLTGEKHLFFYDAVAPIVSYDSIDMKTAFRSSRYDRRQVTGDYINCPFSKDEYETFVDELLNAQRITLREFEADIEIGVDAGSHKYFEGCLPIEILARRGREALAFGPMRPVGLTDPKTNKRPYAVVQLRQDNLSGSLFNIVGFQTNLTYQEQRRVFQKIPGLQQAEFYRYGQMHRNTFLNSPKVLLPTLQYRERTDLFFAGQITGVEGYMGNIATGLLAGWNAARILQEELPLILPQITMLGALCHYITHADPANFQPMKANFGLLPSLCGNLRMEKRERARAYADRAIKAIGTFIDAI